MLSECISNTVSSYTGRTLVPWQWFSPWQSWQTVFRIACDCCSFLCNPLRFACFNLLCLGHIGYFSDMVLHSQEELLVQYCYLRKLIWRSLQFNPSNTDWLIAFVFSIVCSWRCDLLKQWAAKYRGHHWLDFNLVSFVSRHAVCGFCKQPVSLATFDNICVG